MPDIITVQSGRDDDRVVLWERNPEHPEGEAYVAGKTPVRVARTSEVGIRLSRRDLVEVTAAPPPPEPAPETTPEPVVPSKPATK